MSGTRKKPSPPRGADRLHQTQALASRDEAREVYAEWAEAYDGDVEHGLGYLSPRLVADALSRHLGTGSTPLLDAGCGTGLAGEALRQHGSWPLYGLDLSPEMLARARAKGVYQGLIAADLGQPLPLGDGGFSGAVSSGTFSPGHVGPEALAQVLRVLGAGAPFAFTVHEKVWGGGGFRDALERLEEDGTVHLAEVETHRHIAHVPDQSCVVCVALKR